MHLLAYWRIDNYQRDLDVGAGFNFNSKQSRLHSAIDIGETLWLFTAVKNPPRYFIVANLTVRAKTINAPDYVYGDYRVWGDLNQSRYFQVRLDVPGDEAFDLLRGLPLVSGSLNECDRFSLPQACQTIRGLTDDANLMLNEFAKHLADEERAMQVADEYELERELLLGGGGYESIIRRDHVGPSEDRRRQLIITASRDRQLVAELHGRYQGKCQLCAFDSPTVYGTNSAEGHHLEYLSRGGEDKLFNMVLLCPNHHTVVHNTDARFDYAKLAFCFPNGRVEPLCINTHLQPRLSANQPEPRHDPNDESSSDDLSDLASTILSHLTPDLLTDDWKHKDGDHPLKGYCYVVAEAIYHMAGGAVAGLSVHRCQIPDGGTHWWVTDAAGKIIDPTAAQFGRAPPYESGRRTHFLSKQPSQRATQLIDRVRRSRRDD